MMVVVPQVNLIWTINFAFNDNTKNSQTNDREEIKYVCVWDGVFLRNFLHIDCIPQIPEISGERYMEGNRNLNNGNHKF